MMESGSFSISIRLLIYGLSCQMILYIGNPLSGAVFAVFNGGPYQSPRDDKL